MTWAEPVGLGELGLMPDQFWSLTLREFWLKHEAFVRSEDRQRALMIELVAMSAPCSDQARARLHRGVNALRRYPIKRWLLRKPEAQ